MISSVSSLVDAATRVVRSLQRFKWTELPAVETTDVAIGLGDD